MKQRSSLSKSFCYGFIDGFLAPFRLQHLEKLPKFLISIKCYLFLLERDLSILQLFFLTIHKEVIGVHRWIGNTRLYIENLVYVFWNSNLDFSHVISVFFTHKTKKWELFIYISCGWQNSLTQVRKAPDSIL